MVGHDRGVTSTLASGMRLTAFLSRTPNSSTGMKVAGTPADCRLDFLPLLSAPCLRCIPSFEFFWFRSSPDKLIPKRKPHSLSSAVTLSSSFIGSPVHSEFNPRFASPEHPRPSKRSQSPGHSIIFEAGCRFDHLRKQSRLARRHIYENNQHSLVGTQATTEPTHTLAD